MTKYLFEVLKLQQKIIDYITDIRTCAKALQAEGKAILEDAKRKVEQIDNRRSRKWKTEYINKLYCAKNLLINE